jgi:hypothetical protein
MLGMLCSLRTLRMLRMLRMLLVLLVRMLLRMCYRAGASPAVERLRGCVGDAGTRFRQVTG